MSLPFRFPPSDAAVFPNEGQEQAGQTKVGWIKRSESTFQPETNLDVPGIGLHASRNADGQIQAKRGNGQVHQYPGRQLWGYATQGRGV
jgi:hypothetical protein